MARHLQACRIPSRFPHDSAYTAALERAIKETEKALKASAQRRALPRRSDDNRSDDDSHSDEDTDLASDDELDSSDDERDPHSGEETDSHSDEETDLVSDDELDIGTAGHPAALHVGCAFCGLSTHTLLQCSKLVSALKQR